MSSRLRVDAGATWIRLRLLEDGRAVRAVRLPAVPMLSLRPVIGRALRRWKVSRLDELIVGAKGAWGRSPRRALSRSLRGLARAIRVMSDAELTWLSLFEGRPGVLLIAGTGSVAVAGGGSGRLERAGGYGPLLGDEGSAFWIGREGLKRMPELFEPGLALRLAPLWQSQPVPAVRRVAALGRRVLGLCARDERARRIRREAALALAGLAAQARSKAGLKGSVPLACHGGLFQDEGFARAVMKAAVAQGFRKH